MRAVVGIFAALLCIGLGLSPAHAEKRVALVSGNAAYRNVGDLPNPRNDARPIVRLLSDANCLIPVDAEDEAILPPSAPPAPRPMIPERIVPDAPSDGAERAVLYEEDPNDPQGKRLNGAVTWRTEEVSPGAGKPIELAVRADIEIPERGMSLTWTLRRDAGGDRTFSHIIELMFMLALSSPSGDVFNVPGILLKQSEQTRGLPLAGLSVKVTSGYFLIGLSARPVDRDRNIQTLKDRSWFDIPIVYSNNQRAILAMEKGASGERAFAEAFATWSAEDAAATLPEPPPAASALPPADADSGAIK